ncbi:hypothetical protein V8B97DRAFT_1872802 [Scleroderma yunnanense]
MSDPVASKSAFLCMYMRNHPDTLVAYVKYFGKVRGQVVTAQMTAIDTKGMNLNYQMKSGGNDQVYVQFKPPLAGYDDVKPRLLSMKADAQEGLGMIKAPQLTTFELPGSTVYAFLVYLIPAYFTCYPPLGTSIQIPFTSNEIPANIVDIFFNPARAVIAMLGFRPTFRSVVGLILACHTVESLYTWSLCRRYVSGWGVRAAYMVTTLLFGGLGWITINRRIQQKRIESVMKAE